MGANTSQTRKFTIENEIPTSVISVSQDVADRLKGKQKEVRAKDVELSAPVVNNNDGFQSMPLFLHEPSLTSIQLRQAMLEDLKKNDEYWENRIKHLEEHHKKINETMEEEYKKTIEEEEKKRPQKDSRKIAAKFEPPCHDVEQEVIACFKKNKKHPINCADVVQAFQECVDTKRINIMAGKC